MEPLFNDLISADSRPGIGTNPNSLACLSYAETSYVPSLFPEDSIDCSCSNVFPSK